MQNNEGTDTKDLFYFIIPLIHISKVFGIAPFKLDSKTKIRKLIFSSKALTYSVIIFSLIFIGRIIDIYLVTKETYQIVYNKYKIVYMVIHFTTSFIIIVVYLIKYKTVLKLINFLAYFDISVDNDIYEDGKILKTYYRTIIMIAIFIELFVIITLVIVIDVNVQYNTVQFFAWITAFLIFFVTIVSDLQVVNLMLLFKQRFLVLNSAFYYNKFNALLVKKETKSIVNKMSKNVVNDLSSKKLKHLINKYTKFSHICEIFSEAYSVQILFSIALKLIFILFNSYFNVVTMLYEDVGGDYQPFWNVASMVLIANATFHLVIIIWSICAACSEVSR
ncbi:hypothetical protein L9F63_022112, partial [Diploptera punctata]